MFTEFPEYRQASRGYLLKGRKFAAHKSNGRAIIISKRIFHRALRHETVRKTPWVLLLKWRSSFQSIFSLKKKKTFGNRFVRSRPRALEVFWTCQLCSFLKFAVT